MLDKVSSTPPPPPTSTATPAAQFTQLSQYVQVGLLSAQELVQLAPKVFSGGDEALVPSIEAILPLKESDYSQFQEALNLILAQRGISRESPPPASNAASIPTNTSSNNPIAAEEANDKTDTDQTHEAEDHVMEVVVICIDVSGSMESPFEVDDDVRTVDRTRLQAVKQCFYGFRDQTQSHKNGSRHLLGLLSFSDKVVVHTNPTANLDVFEDVIDDMTSKGRTAIFESITVACNQILAPVSKLHPKADLRVLVLSDGLNNCNSVNANDALKALAEIGAVCDCMILGDKTNSADDDLRRLVGASEGQCVQFTGLADAYEALESPAMISLASRRNSDTAIDREALRSRLAAIPTIAKVAAAPIQRSVVKAPVAPDPTASKPSSYVSLDSNTSSLQPRAGGVGKRIMKELTDYAKSPLPNMFLFPGLSEDGAVCESLKVLMVGLDDHPTFKGHAWQINVEFPSSYPFAPPRFRCVTPIYHYAVSAEGSVCLERLKDSWSPAHTAKSVLDEFSTLIHDHKRVDPDCNLAIRSWLSDLLRTNPQEYDIQALRHTQENAKAIPTQIQTLVGNDLYSLLV